MRLQGDFVQIYESISFTLYILLIFLAQTLNVLKGTPKAFLLGLLSVIMEDSNK